MRVSDASVGVAACLIALTVSCKASPPPGPPPTSVEIADPPKDDTAATAPLPVANPEHDPVRPGVTYLRDDAAVRFPRRGRLVIADEVYWEEAAKADAGVTDSSDATTLEEPEELIVVERRPNHLRVVVESHGIRSVAYVKRSDFQTVTARATVVQPTRQKRWPEGIGVRVPPGLSLTWHTETRSHRAVRVSHDGLEFEGWVAADDFGLVYEPEKQSKQNMNAYLLDKTALLSRPGGKEVARLSGQDNFPARTVGSSVNGFQRVVVSHPPYRIEGYVAESRLHRTDVDHEQYQLEGVGLGAWGSSGRKFTLSAGAELYASAEGEQVAVVVRDGTRVSDGFETDHGRRQISYPMNPWSFATAWIDEPPEP